MASKIMSKSLKATSHIASRNVMVTLPSWCCSLEMWWPTVVKHSVTCGSTAQLVLLHECSLWNQFPILRPKKTNWQKNELVDAMVKLHRPWLWLAWWLDIVLPMMRLRVRPLAKWKLHFQRHDVVCPSFHKDCGIWKTSQQTRVFLPCLRLLPGNVRKSEPQTSCVRIVRDIDGALHLSIMRRFKGKATLPSPTKMWRSEVLNQTHRLRSQRKVLLCRGSLNGQTASYNRAGAQNYWHQNRWLVVPGFWTMWGDWMRLKSLWFPTVLYK